MKEQHTLCRIGGFNKWTSCRRYNSTLSGCKCPAQVDSKAVKGLTLAPVNAESPGEYDGYLKKLARQTNTTMIDVLGGRYLFSDAVYTPMRSTDFELIGYTEHF